MAVWFGDQLVTVEALPEPAPLDNLNITFEGDDESTPTSLDYTWTGPSTGHVSHRINRNHHESMDTFIDCFVPAARGLLHVDAEVVTPITNETYIEEHFIEHTFIAAAETPVGCVEFRCVFQHSR